MQRNLQLTGIPANFFCANVRVVTPVAIVFWRLAESAENNGLYADHIENSSQEQKCSFMAGKVTILGGGAMATACAILLADHPQQAVTIWARNPDYAEDMENNRENRRLLPGIHIPEGIRITSDISEAVADAEFLVASIPSKHLRNSLTALSPAIPGGLPVISVVKGIEINTFLRPSQIVDEVLGKRPFVSLSGPSHAEEIAKRLPASVVAASEDVGLAEQVQEMFTTDRFRVYTNTDLIGVELAGALKNIIGIAAGICDGLGYGDNAKSAMVTRGIVEISRFGESLGAQPETFAGLAGIGDLITTCVSPHGRNRAVGERLGKGESLDQILATTSSVAEGVTTTEAIYGLAKSRNVEMPIVNEVYQVLFRGKSPVEATNSLMLRPLKQE
ncbi:Glycerol-3-phosphate dehydrogenase [NAD(P)+] [Thalassoglobus neptunius]|uniref:Glycerol-3-phosphate dehydrogenase [NAD(P)+] n=2 Tax=Thalassoglobus neptunius TaxID=1938619 RepID=A0A5C5X8L6_9PLAN|nr:Glycerol-3-phosphate dehydrogenase [NAD(P)+] [Thalassoglobus neptunius]